MNIKRFVKTLLSSLLLIFCISCSSANAAIEIPNPTNYKYLNDYVGVMNNSEINSILSIGKQLEDKTGAQAIVVIIESTNNIPIEDYANKLFRTWGIGQKGKDNGLLILLSINDRSWRVEVGRGLEGTITDALSNRIMESLAKPSFIQGNYGQGITSSYSSFCDHIASEYGATIDKSLSISPSVDETSNASNSLGGKILGSILLVCLLFDFLFNRGRIFSTLLQFIFFANIGRHGHGDLSGNGGFRGGSSGGGGSSGNW